MIKEGPAHHPHSLRDPRPIADWIEEHARPAAIGPTSPMRTFAKSYYYGLGSTYLYLEKEKTYATCRGPGFVECYDRYDARTESQWGLTGMAVIVPKAAAPGKPWVFRADPIGRDCGGRPGAAGQGLPHRRRARSSRRPARSASSGTRPTSGSSTTASRGSR